MAKRNKKKRKSVKQERNDFKNGSKYSLLGIYGNVDVDKAIDAIKYRAGKDIIDIKFINESSKKACLLLDHSGRAYDINDEQAERYARYLIVPIGYYDKNKREALYASFLKTGIGWEGVYIGTIYQLIKRSVEYNKDYLTPKEEEYVNTFNTPIPLRGFGGIEIMKNLKEDLIELVKKSDTEICNGDDIVQTIEDVEETTDKVNYNENQVDNNEYKKDSIDEMREITLEAYRNRLNLYNEIYDRLLIKENWRISNKNRLGFYIKSIFEKVMTEQRSNDEVKGNGYVLSNDRTKCIVNTGLIDVYNNDIYLLDETNSELNFKFKCISIVSGKGALIDLGFNREDILEMPNPIKFYKDKRELIFSGDIDEFDLEDDYRLNHIIHERKGRFPEKYRDEPSDAIADKIKSAIYRAVKISNRDYKYVIPMFNLRFDRIQYLVPFHLDRQIDEAPELTIVIGKHNGFWTIYTILETDDAYDNARLLCRPDNTWLLANRVCNQIAQKIEETIEETINELGVQEDILSEAVE